MFFTLVNKLLSMLSWWLFQDQMWLPNHLCHLLFAITPAGSALIMLRSSVCWLRQQPNKWSLVEPTWLLSSNRESSLRGHEQLKGRAAEKRVVRRRWKKCRSPNVGALPLQRCRFSDLATQNVAFNTSMAFLFHLVKDSFLGKCSPD